MPKHPFPASRWLLAPLLLAAIMQSGAAHANATGVGLILSVTTVFECADEDMNISEGTCNKDPDAHTAVVGSVNVSAIACRSPADIAGVKLDDVIVSINGVAINGLTQDAYEDLIDMATSENGSWVILRKSFGSWEKKELTLRPAEFGEDFSCGKPDSEM